MDPISALSLAANIIQFIDFGTRLLRDSKEIADTGSSVSVKSLSTLTRDLVEINSALKKQVRPLTPPNVHLS